MINKAELGRSPIAIQEENEWLSFRTKLNNVPREDHSSIEFSLKLAQAAHRGQKRESGEPYVSHPIAAALILIDAGIVDYEIICGALLHDVSEETKKTEEFDYIQRMYTARTAVKGDQPKDTMKILTGALGKNVAKIIDEVSQNKYLPTKQENDTYYHTSIENAWDKSVMVKLADRLHNIQTLAVMPLEKQIDKIRETEVVYKPIFRRASDTYPKEARKLLAQLDLALQQAKEQVTQLALQAKLPAEESSTDTISSQQTDQ